MNLSLLGLAIESLQHGAAPALRAQASCKALKVRGHRLSWWWLSQALLQSSPAPLLLTMESCASPLALWLGKGVGCSPRGHLVPWEHAGTLPWRQQELHVAAVVTRWGRALLTAVGGSPEAEEEGAGASQSINPCESSCCPPAPLLQGKGLSSSCCTCHTPRTVSATWDVPGPGTQLPWKTPRATWHPWTTTGGCRVAPKPQMPAPWAQGAVLTLYCPQTPQALAFLHLGFFPWKELFKM